MAKELFISTTPHETKVAVVEDEQLTEIDFERENEYTHLPPGPIGRKLILRSSIAVRAGGVDVADGVAVGAHFKIKPGHKPRISRAPQARKLRQHPKARSTKQLFCRASR